MLCVGLDTDIDKLPQGIERSFEGMLEFNKRIIQLTEKYAVAYKINTAFYEQYGTAGWDVMEKTLACIPDSCFKIADAKRGDIGNTSSMYARAFFKNLNFDAITVAPYMGEDSLSPFFAFEGKWVICLGLTSNAGSKDFQMLNTDGKLLYERVFEKVSSWGNTNNLMFVTGATRPEGLGELREKYPHHFFLVPGVGAQGGTVTEVCQHAMTNEGGLLINVGRSIIYASSGSDFEEAALRETIKLQEECSKCMNEALN